MKKFRFTLEAVRTLRQRQEQTALEQYAGALRARQKALDALRDTERECEAAWMLRRERTASGAPAAHVAQVQDYCTALESLKKQCAEAVVMAQRVMDHMLENLCRARRAREAVDQFYEWQRERYDREWQREEQKKMDDLAQRRAPQASSAAAIR
jgi:flagellar export protein FliJ